MCYLAANIFVNFMPHAQLNFIFENGNAKPVQYLNVFLGDSSEVLVLENQHFTPSVAANFMPSSLVSTLSHPSVQPPTLCPYLEEDKPPPLPPRRKRESSFSCGEQSPIRAVPERSHIFPRADAGAPPLPPRRSESTHQAPPLLVSRTSLTMSNSGVLHRPPSHGSSHHGAFSSTPPHTPVATDTWSHLSVNGERSRSVTPELPPKTYKVMHSRKQSS